MPPSHLYVTLARVFLTTSLASSVAWIIDYSRDRWWDNLVGRTLVTKTVILALLLLVSLLVSVLRFDSFWLDVVRWAEVGLLGLIGPVMVWRMVVFHRVAAAVTKCVNGHPVVAVARYCPVCGVALYPQLRDEPGDEDELQPEPEEARPCDP